MRIIEAINRIDSLKHNTYTQPEKIAWLSTLDAMAKAHVIDTHEGSENVTFSGYDQNTDLNTVLLIPAPYEEAYIKWLEAQIDYANGEYGKYNNTIESFNTFWNAYKNFYNRTHRPLRNHVRYFGGGRNPGNGGGQAAPPALALLQKQIGDLKNLKTDTKENLVAAINEVLLKGADPEEIQRIVEEYLGENGSGGIHIGPYPPNDPNVDIWIDTSEDLTPPYIPNTMAKPGQIVRVVAVDENGMVTAVEAVDMPSGGNYELPVATADTLGGVKAEPATEDDTQPVRIGEDGMLYTAPGSGGGDKWETIVDYTVPEDCMQVFLKTDISGNPFKLKEAVLLMVLHPLESGGTPTSVRCTVDGTLDGGASCVYSADHYTHGFPGTPEAGKYTYVRMNLVSTANGVWLREYVYNNNGTADSNGLTGGRTQGIHENIHIDTLQSPVREISAVGLGSYGVAVGKGTRIVMVGVRE